MTGKQVAVLTGLGITVLTVCYLAGMIVLTDFMSLLSEQRLSLSSTPNLTLPQQPVMKLPIVRPPAALTAAPEDRFPVTDPRLVTLDVLDVPNDVEVQDEYTRYVDNGVLIDNSTTPARTETALRDSGRLNGFQIAFASTNPAASQLRSDGILNFAEIYQAPEQAGSALEEDPPLLASRFPGPGNLILVQEEPPIPNLGREARSFQALFLQKGRRTPAYTVIFCRKNTLVGITILGVQKDKLMAASEQYGRLLDRRIQEFGKGLAA